MEVFQDADGRSVLAVNNEYVNRAVFYPGGAPRGRDDVRKGKAGHGVSIFEIAETGGAWSIVLDSPYNRRITADTPMEITGPARGHRLVATAADPAGVSSLGTWNDCGSGRTPWGTYLACEENFHGYFSSSDPALEIPPAFARYGIGREDRGHGWAAADARFDVARHPNEPNRAGYVVEIDPLAPASVPRKRTALGRFKHENAEVVLAADGRAVVYMGDDERGEFVYRFVSAGRYAAAGDNSRLLEDGALFAARFHGGGRGEWVELTPEAAGMASRAEVCIHTRMAASPDGLAFDRRGLLWIQTDGDYSDSGPFAGQGNNQMLAADPETGEIRRFLVGPRECEVTGLAWSADRRTMFVGIQHPGEKGGSHFPDGGAAPPRSAVVAVRRDDGGRVG